MAGVVDTPINGDQRGDIEAWAQTSLPARRFGQPEDIADAVMFAAGNPYLTGSLITIDGGLTVS